MGVFFNEVEKDRCAGLLDFLFGDTLCFCESPVYYGERIFLAAIEIAR
jgi:hypothetical protein